MTRSAWVLFILLIVAGTVSGQSLRFRSGVFLHHSTGGCIWGPNGSATSVPDEMTAYNSLHGYTDSLAVTMEEEGWPVNPWDNEWYRWHRIFDNDDPQADIRPYYATDRIIVIKSCFPSSSIWGDGNPSDTLNPTDKTLMNYKWHWRNIVGVMRAHPENFFVIWTNAPLVPDATNDDEAHRSDQFCRWAKDTLAAGNDLIVGSFPENVYVFDFFHKLVDASGKLRIEYASSSGDSHPNAAATALVAPQFVSEVFDAAIGYESSFLTPPAMPVQLAPPDDAMNQARRITFQWNHSASALTYHLLVAEDDAFASIVAEDSLLVDTHCTFFMPAESTRYYWKIHARNSVGQSAWSPTWSLLTAPAAPQTILVRARWNLVSLPGHCPDESLPALFPTAGSPAFCYSEAGEYLAEDTLEPGTGYWIKFPYEQIVALSYEPSVEETVAVHRGWNIIGAAGYPIAVENIVSQPGGVATSSFFAYDGGYATADSLRPGKAYWVNVASDCSLILSVGGASLPANVRIRIDDSDALPLRWGKDD